MRFYFSPRDEVLSCEQIQGLTGVDPRATDKEVLNFMGIFKVSELGGGRDPFLSPESVYEIKEGVAYERQSPEPLPLIEAKEKARQYLLERSRNVVQSAVESSGVSPEFLAVESLSSLKFLKSLRDQISNEALNLERKLSLIENASVVNELKEICYGG